MDERHQRSQASEPFQVLSLDGGGVRGIFAAAILARLEEDIGRPVLDYFDLIAGTSTGGIIALGLGLGLTPRQIVDFYVAERGRIFPNRLGWRSARHLIRAKYGAGGLRTALEGVFGNTLLGESKIPLVIPTYNLGENDVYLFKTPHHSRLKRDHTVPMWAVAMAASAAPTYFPAFRLPGADVRLVDGGVWANNPAMVGVTEAVSMFGRRPEDVRILSLGTTVSARTRRARLDNGGLLQWASHGPRAVDVLLRGQSVGAFAQVLHLVGKDNACRLDPTAPDELARLDACDARELVAKAAHHSRVFCPEFERVFGDHVATPYAPFYGPNAREGAHVDN